MADICHQHPTPTRATNQPSKPETWADSVTSSVVRPEPWGATDDTERKGTTGTHTAGEQRRRRRSRAVASKAAGTLPADRMKEWWLDHRRWNKLMHCIHGNPVAGGAVDAAGLPDWGAEWTDKEYLAECRKLEEGIAAESDWASESSSDWANSPREAVEAGDAAEEEQRPVSCATERDEMEADHDPAYELMREGKQDSIDRDEMEADYYLAYELMRVGKQDSEEQPSSLADFLCEQAEAILF